MNKPADDTPKGQIETAIEKLSERERRILTARLGLFGTDRYSLDETGRMFKISKERVRQLERRAIEKLEKFIAPEIIAAARNVR